MALTAQEQKELAALESKYGKEDLSRKNSLTPIEEDELKQLESKYGSPSMWDKAKDYGKTALDYGLRTLDYGPGVLRTAGQTAYDIGRSLIDPSHKMQVRSDDIYSAFKGKAPLSAEMLERRGVGEGPSVDLNKITAGNIPVGKISARDALGFGMDVAIDPMTISNALPKAVKPLSALTEEGGRSMFKSGLKKVDEKLIEKGKKPVADLLLNEGKAGSVKKLSEDSRQMADKLMRRRDELYQFASDSGARVDISSAVKNAEAEIAKMRSNPGQKELADKLTDFLNQYKAEGFTDIQSLSDWKTALYDSLPQTAFGPNGTARGPAKKFEKALARDFKIAIEKGAEEVAPGIGKEISKVNDELGTHLQARKPFEIEVRKSNTPNYLTVMDAMMGGGLTTLGATPLETAGALAAKKAAEMSRTTGFRTRGGLLLNRLGKSGLLDAGARRGLINSKKED